MCAKGWNYNKIIVSNGQVYIIDVKHPLYRLRYTIMTRCYNADEKDFAYYQGKGITVCDEWKCNPESFYQWCLDNGWKKGVALDRIDPDKNYSPENCQFIELSENLKKMHQDRNMAGENAPNAKLTLEQVIEIKRRLALGITSKRIADDFNVAPSTIGAIKRGTNWR